MRKYKRHMIYVVVIINILSLVCINNISALSYESSVGIGFTFNPTLSVSLSSNDLVIANLTPGSSDHSNSINVSVATNASYGYTLSAIAGDSTHNNSNLTHSNNTDIFSSIATNADLANLDDSEDNNIWGYTTSLDNGSTWSNYNGLSGSSSTTLIDKDNNAPSTIDFKIAAKASSTQASGTYTNTINFAVVSKPIPMTLLDAFVASSATQQNGYYTMQGMTSDICNVAEEGSELQLLDERDNKLYWVAKLKDRNCWMTQNLDFDITAGTTAITSDNTDLSTDQSVYTATNTIYTIKGENDSYGYMYENGVATWIPERSTYTSVSAPGSQNWAGNTGNNATSGYYHPYSWNRIANSNGNPVYPDSTVTKAVAGNHAQSGNYYNWSAAIASNYSYAASGNQKNSICPSGWRLPVNGEYGTLYNASKTADNTLNNAYGLMASPLWFVRSGDVNGSGGLNFSGNIGFYWSSTVSNGTDSYDLRLNFDSVSPAYSDIRYYGFSVRCVAK